MAVKRGYGQFCPVALAAEILAERWTPLVIRELLCGSVRFNELQRGLPRMSSALLGQRLQKLQLDGIVEHRKNAAGSWEYVLTPSGRELRPIIETMGAWAQRWLRHDLVNPANLDPDLLMWDIRRNVVARFPSHGRRYVVEFDLSGVPVRKRRYWLVAEKDYVDLCYKPPGFEVDLFVSAALAVLTQVWLGHLSIDGALADGRLRLDGGRKDLSAFRAWFVLSSFAPFGAQAAGQPEIDLR
ncbi:helix-turn-helix domain-containing protein [Amaricoccus sp.]|uniref:winged helix-turn-helix transcriptional regulator n=1 Tax=Amaricoccus sp. TaxID=1872485 RepID=UPI0026023D7A|nr:helix-turn-helix domain-containing protein [Amaricoccus sp.]HRO10604.1 helix-turn-helix domain-containing protein [Amaricoccus sp.]